MGFCVQSTRAFFTNTSNHLATFLRTADGPDKVLKVFGSVILPVAGRYAGPNEGIKTARAGVKITRTVNANFNVFRGVIPGMVHKAKQIRDLCEGLDSGDDVQVKHSRKGKQKFLASVTIDDRKFTGNIRHLTWQARCEHNEMAVGKAEKCLKLGEDVTELVGGLTYIAGFSLARPVGNLRKYFKVKFGAVGNGIADSFPYLMFVNHVAGLFQNTFSLAYQFKAQHRATTKVDTPYPCDDAAFAKKIVLDAILFIEKILDLIKDVFFLTANAMPFWMNIVLDAGISGFGLYRTWKKTA